MNPSSKYLHLNKNGTITIDGRRSYKPPSLDGEELENRESLNLNPFEFFNQKKEK